MASPVVMARTELPSRWALAEAGAEAKILVLEARVV